MASNSPYSGSTSARSGGNSTGASTGGTSGSAGETIDRVKQGAHDTIGQLAERAKPAMERLGSSAESVKSSVDEASRAIRARAGEMQATSDDWMQTLRSTIREHPIAAVAVAVSVGMVLGRMGGDE
jgi:ElaB/YqjD/DUF883 family membrane-anchored ribosome-binding protein